MHFCLTYKLELSTTHRTGAFTNGMSKTHIYAFSKEPLLVFIGCVTYMRRAPPVPPQPRGRVHILHVYTYRYTPRISQRGLVVVEAGPRVVGEAHCDLSELSILSVSAVFGPLSPGLEKIK